MMTNGKVRAYCAIVCSCLNVNRVLFYGRGRKSKVSTELSLQAGKQGKAGDRSGTKLLS